MARLCASCIRPFRDALSAVGGGGFNSASNASSTVSGARLTFVDLGLLPLDHAAAQARSTARRRDQHTVWILPVEQVERRSTPDESGPRGLRRVGPRRCQEAADGVPN